MNLSFSARPPRKFRFFPRGGLVWSLLLGFAALEAKASGLFQYPDLPNSFGDGNLDSAGYSFQDRQPLASFEAPDGTLWQVMGYISLNRLPVVQWRYRAPDSGDWSLWARIGQDASVLPATGDNWHGYLSLAIDTAGYLHLAYDGRLNAGRFRFHRSDTPLHQGWTGGLIDRSNHGLPGWSSTTRSTYWRFAKHPETGLLTLSLRESGNGHALFVLDADTQEWSAFPGTRPSDGRLLTNSGIFAQYVSHDVVFRGDDVFVGFTERQDAGGRNKNLSVIKYAASDHQWQRLDGTPLTVPVLPEQGTILDPSETESMLDQRWDLMVDGHDLVHGFYRRQDSNGFLQIFHFWIDHDDAVHGPRPLTDFTYTDFWHDINSASGVNLSKPFSFYLGDTLYLAWQEEDHGQRTRAMASRYPFTDWSAAQQIDDTHLYTSNPEFERWAWDTRQEIWLAALPFSTKTSAGRPVQLKQIPHDSLPTPPPLQTFDDWVQSFPGLTESERTPTAAPAGDGIANLYKFAMDMHPEEDGRTARAQLDSGGLPWIKPAPGDPMLVYRANTSLADIEILVERSQDLDTWVTEERTPTVLEQDGDIQLRGMSFPPDSLPDSPLFLRLRVKQL